jgi:hypothetical protein
MGWYGWLLALHLLSAFAVVAAIVLFGVMLVGMRGSPGEAASPAVLALRPVADGLWAAGGLAVVVFGVWLAIYVHGYELWDGWILAAFVLYGVASAAGARVGRAFRQRVAADPRMYGLMAAATLLLLVDMIYKPGA